MRKWQPIAIALALSFAGSGAHARIMEQEDRIAFVKETLPKTSANLKAGNVAMARVQLMAMRTLFEGKDWQAVPPESAALYEDLVDAAWPDEVTEENIGAVVEALDKQSKAYSEKIAKVAQAANIEEATLNGLEPDNLAKLLMAASKAYPEVCKIAMEYVKDVPNPEVQLGDAATNTEARKLLYDVALVALVDGFPESYAREHLVPGALEEAEKDIAELKKALSTPVSQIEETTANGFAGMAQRISQLAGYVSWADPENARGKEVASTAEALGAKAKETLQAVISAARMPKDLYPGADAAALKARIAVLHKQDNPDILLRVTLCSRGWKTVQRWVDEGNTRRWEDLRYVTGALAVHTKVGKGPVRVVFVTYAQDRKGAAFGPLRFYGIGDQYTILKENVMK